MTPYTLAAVAGTLAPRPLEWHEAMDLVERAIAQNLPDVELPLRHTFTPGLYSREMTIPAGTVLTSKVHKTEHQWVLSAGAMIVRDEKQVGVIRAPYSGVTKPGTRRIAYVLEDAVFTTFHVTDKTDVDEIEKDIIEQRSGHLAGIERPVLAER